MPELTTKNSGSASKAAAAIEHTVTSGDPPSESNDQVENDFDFQNYDPSEITPYLKKHGLTVDLKKVAVCWVEKDIRVWDRYVAMGWTPFAEGRVIRGTTVLCHMPRARREAIIARGQEKARMLLNAPMSRFDDEADKYKSQGISSFDGSRNARDGLD